MNQAQHRKYLYITLANHSFLICSNEVLHVENVTNTIAYKYCVQLRSAPSARTVVLFCEYLELQYHNNYQAFANCMGISLWHGFVAKPNSLLLVLDVSQL